LFNIEFVEFSPGAENALLQHNTSLNFIYQSDPGLPGGQPFASVIDAVPGDGFNPIWEEVQITFNHGHTPRKLFSDTEVEAAAAVEDRTGRTRLAPKSLMMRCSTIRHRSLNDKDES
jgi:hypothetical protein